MKPVHQTIFGNGEGPKAGNCFQACIASVLELNLDEVPHFVAHEGDDWYEKAQEWLRENFALQFISWQIPEGDPEEMWWPEGITLLSGKSPRGDFNHVVVGRGREMIHDPHPSGAGLGGRITEIEVLASLDPALQSNLAKEIAVLKAAVDELAEHGAERAARIMLAEAFKDIP